MTTLQLHTVDVVERAVKTFVQGFLVVWGLSNYTLSKVALWAAAMAGLSAVWNTTGKLASAQQSTPPVVTPPTVTPPAAPVV